MSSAPATDSTTIHSLSYQEIDAIRSKSLDVRSKAYCPYSKFRVGSALLLNTGEIIIGANIENAAYPVGTCAERVAFGTAIMAGHKFGSFRAIAVASDLDEPCSPCGMCRQFIREFCPPKTPIFMFKRDGSYIVNTLEELLPLSFGPDALARQEELRSQA